MGVGHGVRNMRHFPIILLLFMFILIISSISSIISIIIIHKTMCDTATGHHVIITTHGIGIGMRC